MTFSLTLKLLISNKWFFRKKKGPILYSDAYKKEERKN